MSAPKRFSSFWPSPWFNWGSQSRRTTGLWSIYARSPDGKYALQSRFRVGETLYLADRHEEARVQLEDFRTAHGDDPLCAYVYPYLGEIALATDQLEEARAHFAEGLKLFPDGPLSNECRFGLRGP